MAAGRVLLRVRSHSGPCLDLLQSGIVRTSARPLKGPAAVARPPGCVVAIPFSRHSASGRTRRSHMRHRAGQHQPIQPSNGRFYSLQPPPPGPATPGGWPPLDIPAVWIRLRPQWHWYSSTALVAIPEWEKGKPRCPPLPPSRAPHTSAVQGGWLLAPSCEPGHTRFASPPPSQLALPAPLVPLIAPLRPTLPIDVGEEGTT